MCGHCCMFPLVLLPRIPPGQILFIAQSQAKRPLLCGNFQRSTKTGFVLAHSMILLSSIMELPYCESLLCTGFSLLLCCEVFSELILFLSYPSDHLSKHLMNGYMKDESHNFSFTFHLLFYREEEPQPRGNHSCPK